MFYPPPSFEFEKQMEKKYGPYVAGIDEVGRGPLAGPVIAASSIIFDQESFLRDFSNVNDSKTLSKKQRETLFEKLTQCPFFQYSLGQASVEEIDQLNIRNATFLAMKRALKNIQRVSSYLVDGNALPCFDIPGKFIIKGDLKSYSIAAASIIAKVTRDRFMTELSSLYPAYHWDKNAGYGTQKHREALKKFGITPHHRKSFAPVYSLIKEKV